MSKKLFIIFLLVSIAEMTGCATSNLVKHKPAVMENRKVDNHKVFYRSQTWDKRNGIELECRSASKLGCRHKGRVYPWNAWLGEKGYDAKDYDLKEVVQSGSRATVVIVKR